MIIDEKLEKESAREYALRVIRKNIVELQLIPGAKVSENELAAEMGISRTPVREALIDLSKNGIVEIYPQRGSYISLIDRKSVDDAHFVRIAMECAAVKEVCSLVTDGQINALASNIRMQQTCVDNQNYHRLLHLDDEFHYMLFEIADKAQAYDFLKTLMLYFDRVRRLQMQALDRQFVVDDHRNILRAIETRDTVKAQQMMYDHLQHYSFDWEKLIRRFPNYFRK